MHGAHTTDRRNIAARICQSCSVFQEGEEGRSCCPVWRSRGTRWSIAEPWLLSMLCCAEDLQGSKAFHQYFCSAVMVSHGRLHCAWYFSCLGIILFPSLIFKFQCWYGSTKVFSHLVFTFFFWYKETILTAQSNDIFYLLLSEKQWQHQHTNILNKN